ncbi:MAG: hypothetical protein R2824_32070 [Saprospiraceae bacterium]
MSNNETIEQLISKGKLELAIENLLSKFVDSPLHSEVLILASNFNTLKSSITKGILSSNEIRREENRIILLALELNRKRVNDYISKEPSSMTKIQLIIEGHLDEFSTVEKEKLKKILATLLYFRTLGFVKKSESWV